ncbi:MAG: site-specific integrase [Acidaminococcaceae bacterium]
MASIKKRGDGYLITVSKGYDINGKQLREYTTWTPALGMTPKQVEKELARQAVLFEEQVQGNTTKDGNTRLVDFTEIFLKEYARPTLKARTAFGYEQRMNDINQAIGHIKLKDLKPGHIAAFYANLQEAGMRRKTLAAFKGDFLKWVKQRHTCMAVMSLQTGVSLWCFKQMKKGKPIDKKSAETIAKALGNSYKGLFETRQDTTPLTAGTIHTYHRTLSAVLFRAVKWGYIKDNPASRADLPSLAGRKAAYLDEPDARRLLELLQAEHIKWRAIITFDLLSGLRRGELLGLRWSDVDIDAQTITISQTSNYLPGRGVYVDTPKTVTSNRPLKLSLSAFLLLLEYKQWQDAQKEALGDAWEDKDGRVFTSDTGAPIFPDAVTQWFTKFVKRTGLPKVTVHSLWHTYASLMIADGVPLIVVSHQLGHAQASTTANIYAHVIAAAEAKAAQTFDRFNDLVAPGGGEVVAESEDRPKGHPQSRGKAVV